MNNSVTKRFMLDDVEVDVDRSSVIVSGEVVSVEPRAMDVLYYLANHAGEVVSQQTLFDNLWPDTTFSSGAILRCIAQLRKALSDDAKQPRFIITHPKRGYSLDVIPSPFSSPSLPHWKKLTSLIVLSVVVGMLFWLRPANMHTIKGVLSPVTSSSDYEFMPVYSSSGDYLAFISQTEQHNQVMLKSTRENTNTTLISGTENYQGIAWDPNSADLYYIVRSGNGDWIGRVNINTKSNETIFKNSEPGDIWKIVVDANFIYFIHAVVPVNSPPKTQLVRLDKHDFTQQTLLISSADFTPYRIAKVFDQYTLAIAGETAEGEVAIKRFNTQTQHLSKAITTLPLGFTEVNPGPNKESLLVHHMNELFTLTGKGIKQKIPYFSYQRLFNPSFHPNGTRVAISQTSFDSDIMELGADNILRPLVDSSGEDHLARYSSDGKNIAFLSSRSGRQQVYLLVKDQQRLIYDNPENTAIYRAPAWSKDSERIFFAIGKTLHVYSIREQQTLRYNMPDDFTALLDVYNNEQKLLVASKRNNQTYFDTYDLSSGESIQLAEAGVNFHGRLNRDDQLCFFKHANLHCGEKVVAIPQEFDVNGRIFPLKNRVVFQSNRDIYQYDGRQFSKLNSEPVIDGLLLSDVQSQRQMLFQTLPQNGANIVEIY